MSTRLLYALKALRSVAPILAEHKSPAGFSYAGGICRNVEQFIDWELWNDRPYLDPQGRYIVERGIRRELEQLMALWPKYSGSWCYPVGGLEEFDIEEHKGTLWNNPKRIELLDWCIERLEAEQ